MAYIILSVLVIIGAFFTFRYFALLYSLKKMAKTLQEIEKDFEQSQIILLPTPNKQLATMVSEMNKLIESSRSKCLDYSKKEKQFKKEIENISHDLRTPLTVILGYLKLYKNVNNEDLLQSATLKDDLAIIENKAELMKNLVAKFYEYSRLDNGNYVVEKEKLDSMRILREMFLSSYHMLEEAHLKIEVNIPEEPIWVIANTLALNRIFANLLENASRYAVSFFEIKVNVAENRLYIQFINDTDNLKNEDITKLFDRFYCKDSARMHESTGVGLTVAKLLANEIDASLTAYKLNNTSICFELKIDTL